MSNIFELRDRYMYARFAADSLAFDSLVDWVQAFLDHPDFRTDANVLWDASAIVRSDLSFGDMEKFGDYLLANRARRGGGYSGFVTDNDLVFGLFRTHEMLNQEKFDYEYRVFRSLVAATEWMEGKLAESS